MLALKLKNKVFVTWSAFSHMYRNDLLTDEVIDDSFENILEKVEQVHDEIKKFKGDKNGK